MKICKCQFCGTITKVDWTKGPLPSCSNCQGVFDLEDIYDEEDEDFDEDAYVEDEEEYDDEEDYDEDMQSMHKTNRHLIFSLLELALIIGCFVYLGWIRFDFPSSFSKADKLSQKNTVLLVKKPMLLRLLDKTMILQVWEK